MTGGPLPAPPFLLVGERNSWSQARRTGYWSRPSQASRRVPNAACVTEHSPRSGSFTSWTSWYYWIFHRRLVKRKQGQIISSSVFPSPVAATQDNQAQKLWVNSFCISSRNDSFESLQICEMESALQSYLMLFLCWSKKRPERRSILPVELL